MKRDIVIDEEIWNRSGILNIAKRIYMNNVLSSQHQLHFDKTELNPFSYYFHTC